MGNYAVKLTFDDGHDTGLYSWDYLQMLGADYDNRWADYLQRLQDAGHSHPSFNH